MPSVTACLALDTAVVVVFAVELTAVAAVLIAACPVLEIVDLAASFNAVPACSAIFLARLPAEAAFSCLTRFDPVKLPGSFLLGILVKSLCCLLFSGGNTSMRGVCSVIPFIKIYIGIASIGQLFGLFSPQLKARSKSTFLWQW